MRQLLAGLLCCWSFGTVAEAPVAIAVHGGAGTITRDNMSPEQEAAFRTAMDQAVSSGYAALQRGESGIDVVVAVIKLLEDSPLFNAGHGAVLTWDGHHELDASIMSGSDLAAGAVAGAKSIKNPIEAARAVMLASPHVLLSGQGADAFAEMQGLEIVPNRYFTTPRRLKALERYKSAQVEKPADSKFGTVGVVVLDREGNLAAGTSTGGMTGKRWGRVGDAPLIGAGTYADNSSCAVSATGHGEFFIRWQVASDICARVKYTGVTLRAAADAVIQEVLVPEGGEGGVVAIDAAGSVAMVFNTEGMYRASIDREGNKVLGIYKNVVPD
jgi:beta-aspartyl-peptidase (threonine type)